MTGTRGSLDAPLRVAVHGLPGVGTSAVAAALAALGRFEIVAHRPDVAVRVIAEVVKPEDRQVIAEAAGPVLVVLTKADLGGFGPGGPVETARRRCAHLAGLTATPTEPLLALAALDPDILDESLVAALQMLVDTPADLRTAEMFVAGPHPVPAAHRQRLVDALDLFGIAHAVVALRDGHSIPQVLRRVSGVDEIAARIEALGAEVRYRRLQALVADWDLRASADPDTAEMLAGDDVVLARMAAAVDVLSAAGLILEVPDTPAAHLQRALRWRTYGAGPVSALHRACAADVTRGSLRLWGAHR
jgi:hypothetical protein